MAPIWKNCRCHGESARKQGAILRSWPAFSGSVTAMRMPCAHRSARARGPQPVRGTSCRRVTVAGSCAARVRGPVTSSRVGNQGNGVERGRANVNRKTHLKTITYIYYTETSRTPRHNRHFRMQRAMHRALVGDLHQARALRLVEFAGDLDLALDTVHLAVAGFAFGAIGGVNFLM